MKQNDADVKIKIDLVQLEHRCMNLVAVEVVYLYSIYFTIV